MASNWTRFTNRFGRAPGPKARRLRMVVGLAALTGLMLSSGVPSGQTAVLNILSNYSFEQDSFFTASTTANKTTYKWAQWKSGSSGAKRYCPHSTLPSPDAYHGSCVFNLNDRDPLNRAASLSQNVPAGAGNTYCLRGKAWGYNGSGGNGGYFQKLALSFRDANWNYIGATGAYIPYNTKGWATTPLIKMVAPAGTRYVQVGLFESPTVHNQNPWNDWDYIILDQNNC